MPDTNRMRGRESAVAGHCFHRKKDFLKLLSRPSFWCWRNDTHLFLSCTPHLSHRKKCALFAKEPRKSSGDL